jgi:3-oxoacyl-[acyl-carrier-protein] synthase III
VAGEFGGLFGDGASAFVLRDARDTAQAAGYLLDGFFFGCLGQYAEAVSVTDAKDGGLTLQFDGEALSRAAVTRMEKMISELEVRSGISRKCVRAFATHQPNPRLVALLAKQCRVAPSLFPDVSRTAGNLGSSTCGVALHMALKMTMQAEKAERGAIFLASLGPGLIYGAGWATAESAF